MTRHSSKPWPSRSLTLPVARAKPALVWRPLCTRTASAGRAEPVRPLRFANRMPPTNQDVLAEMWREYILYRAAGLLHLWRQKWRAFLPPEQQPEAAPSNG